jgi:serine/threonine protein kinase
MAEQPPELVEQVGNGPNGATWKARQPDGREVLAFQTILTDEPARQAALDRLRRLAKIPTHRLAPIRGWWADAEGVWVVGDLEQGVGLPDLPGGGFLSPQQAAAISFGVLEGLDALHADGLNHGDLAPANVRVMPDGNIRLTGHQLATLHSPSQEELVAELRDAGRLVCQAFGIAPERDSRAAPRAIEHAAPALVVTARAIAGGTMRSDIKAALTALRETSGPLGGSERLSLGAGELAALVATKRGGGGGQVTYRNLNAPIESVLAEIEHRLTLDDEGNPIDADHWEARDNREKFAPEIERARSRLST